MEKNSTKKTLKSVIAYRKKCKTDGTGLSHYIMINKQPDKNAKK